MDETTEHCSETIGKEAVSYLRDSTQVISLRKSSKSTANQIWSRCQVLPALLTWQIRSSVYYILIWDPWIFNLYNLWQTRCIYIRRKPHQYGLHFYEQIARTRFLLLQPFIRPVPAQVILLWKGPPKLCIECQLVPLWAFPPKSPGLLRRRSSLCTVSPSLLRYKQAKKFDALFELRWSHLRDGNFVIYVLEWPMPIKKWQKYPVII